MTLKQIKFNPFQHWENISDLYKTVLSKGGANSFGLGDVSILPINQ
ncbi:hypothetical protein HRE60_03070 [Streptococcus salivarius]|uniref:Uncharacterized protein n=1 Tax=Streptococcus salivarius TaxID=1304 RepID=A0A7L6WIK8_STRSL|nr:hypothetical protein [Streptococcus salivarius]QMI50663.1 hypothetical protein HRE60_03070 [Streptococcus salivarius]